MTNPTNKNFKVYQASAGAGKTYTIVKEYLKLCLKNEKTTSEFSHILAITFTNMAANEMKEKIVKQLVKIIKSDPNVEPKDMDSCVGCASCAIVCPDGCITVYRKKVE